MKKILLLFVLMTMTLVLVAQNYSPCYTNNMAKGGDNCEGEGYRPSRGITSGIINMLQELCDMTTEDNELRVMEKYENDLVQHSPQLSRLDKSILYYWDAYRFYLIDASYNEAVGCLNKILMMAWTPGNAVAMC